MQNAPREQFYGSLVLSCRFLFVVGVDVVSYSTNKPLLGSFSAPPLFVFVILLDIFNLTSLSFPFSCVSHI